MERGSYFEIHTQEHFPEPKNKRIFQLEEHLIASSTMNDKGQTQELFIMKFQNQSVKGKKSYKLPGDGGRKLH